MNFPTLTTSRLVLREICVGDASDVFTLFSSPKVMEFYDADPYIDIEQAKFGYMQEALISVLNYGLIP
jgi:RimJ/RimL family protein N-acetyltransferase